MRWTLFARLDPTVARARRLDLVADRPEFLRVLEQHNPGLDHLGLDHMAEVALALLRRLPHDIDEAAASLVDVNPLAPIETLARVASLAYVALRDDLVPDDLPGGLGLIDDAISLRATGVGAPNGGNWGPSRRGLGWGPSQFDEGARERELGVEARFLSLFLPRERMAEFDRALGELFWTITSYTRAPLSVVKDRTRRLIEQPPETLAELWSESPRHDHSAANARPPLFELCDATLEAGGNGPRFSFSDGIVIELVGAQLRLVG